MKVGSARSILSEMVSIGYSASLPPTVPDSMESVASMSDFSVSPATDMSPSRALPNRSMEGGSVGIGGRDGMGGRVGKVGSRMGPCLWWGLG